MGFMHSIIPDSGCSAGFSAIVQELQDSPRIQHSGVQVQVQARAQSFRGNHGDSWGVGSQNPASYLPKVLSSPLLSFSESSPNFSIS
jgi:hypothetical protein